MKKLDWFILIFVIIAIAAIGIWVFMSSSEETETSEEKKETKLESLSNRLKAIQQQINDEIESLRLTTEVEQYLDRKIGRIFLLAKTIFLILFSAVVYLFIYNGSDFLTALFNTLGIASFVAVAIPFLFLSKVLDINALINFIKIKIKGWIYGKYGYNPAMISILKESIEFKAVVEKELKDEMKSLNVIVNNQ